MYVAEYRQYVSHEAEEISNCDPKVEILASEITDYVTAARQSLLFNYLRVTTLECDKTWIGITDASTCMEHWKKTSRSTTRAKRGG
jgi:hypothetical protein